MIYNVERSRYALCQIRVWIYIHTVEAASLCADEGIILRCYIMRLCPRIR